MAIFTAVDVALSLIGNVTALLVLVGFLVVSWRNTWNLVFLVTTALTT